MSISDKTLNKFATQEQAQTAADYDFECVKTFYRTSLSASEWQIFIENTLNWDVPKQTVGGFWVTKACPFSDAVYETLDYSENLFPKSKPLSYFV